MKLTQIQAVKFQPDRLIQARLVKKWTQPDLADKMEISRQMISSYEKPATSGKTPSPENLRKLVRELEIHEGFLFTPLRESEKKLESAINFRTLKSKKRRARGQAETYMQWLISTFDFVSEYVELPAVDMPVFKISDFLHLTNEDIEDIAENTRRYFKLGDGPISNLTRLLENKGVVVGRVPLESGMDGVSAWYNGRPVILVNSNAFYARSRFDLAHELFHLIAHRDVTMDDLEDKDTLNIIEKQAHQFAGAFLAPYKTFLQEVYNIDQKSLIDLKKRWGISVQAIIVRLNDLRIISDFQKTRFFTKINADGWRRKEPLDSETEPEKPNFLYKAAFFCRDNNVFNLDEFVIRSRMPEKFMNIVSSIPRDLKIPENVVAFRKV